MENFVHTLDLPSRLKLVCNVSNATQDLKWSTKTLLQFGRARESRIFGGYQNYVPNLELHYLMVLVIFSLLSLLCMLHISLISSN